MPLVYRLRETISGYLAVFRLKLLLSTALTTLSGSLYAIYVSGVHGSEVYVLTLVALLVIGTLLAHIAMHALDDYLDVVEGLDKGLPRELYTTFGYYYSPVVEGKISLKETLAVAIATLIAGLAIGVYLALERGPLVLVFAIVGALIILSYHSFLLSLLPGEVALFAKDLLVFTGSYYVIAQSLSVQALALACAISTAHILYSINKIPRASYDRVKGRKTFASILGDRFWVGFLLMLLLMISSLGICLALGFLPYWSLLAVVSLIPILQVYRDLKIREVLGDVSRLKRISNIVQASLLRYKILLAASIVIALCLGRV